MGAKAFFLVLAVLALYAGAVVLGQRGGLSGCMPSRETAEALRARWLEPSSVEATELQVTCQRQDRRLEFSGGCKLEVPKRATGSRSLRLKSPSSVRFDYRPRGDDAVGLQSELEPDASAELVVPEEGARLILSCNEATDCVVLIE